jgi:hypothetical protein
MPDHATPAEPLPPAPSGSADDPGYLFVANERCLDFVNTEVVGPGGPVDLLAGFDDLVAWLARAGGLDAAAAGAAAAHWGTPGAAAAAGARLRGLAPVAAPW